MSYTEAQIKTMMKGTGNSKSQPKLPDYKKIDKDVYEQFKSGIGFTEKSLKESYEGFSFPSEFKFGLGLGKLPEAVYSGNLGASSEYVNTRIEVLNEIIGMFESAKTPEDKHKIVALLEMSKKAAGADPSKAAHYIELIEAAKVAISGDQEAKQNFKDYEKTVIYDDQASSKLINELVKRREHLQAIKTQGYDSFSKYNVFGAIADNGVTVTGQSIGCYFTYKGFKAVPGKFKALRNINTALNESSLASKAAIEAAELTSKGSKIIAGKAAAMNAATAAKVAATKVTSTLTESPILGRLFSGGKSLFSYINKGLNSCVSMLPGPAKIYAKVAIMAIPVLIAGSKAFIAAKENPDWFAGIGKTLVGDAKNGWAAAASWVLPDLGLLAGGSWFMNNNKEKQLVELKGAA